MTGESKKPFWYGASKGVLHACCFRSVFFSCRLFPPIGNFLFFESVFRRRELFCTIHTQTAHTRNNIFKWTLNLHFYTPLRSNQKRFSTKYTEREREEKKALNKDRSDTHSHSIYACTEHIKHCPQDQISNNLMYVWNPRYIFLRALNLRNRFYYGELCNKFKNSHLLHL